MDRRQTRIERIECRNHFAEYHAARVDYCRAVGLVGRSMAARRRGSGCRCGGVDSIHTDVMGGRLVQNITIRCPVTEVDGGRNCDSAEVEIEAGTNAIVTPVGDRGVA